MQNGETEAREASSLGALTPVLLAKQFLRRTRWFTDRVTPRRALNGMGAAAAMAGRSEIVPGWPTILKIDISPICNLRCPVCVHANAEELPELAGQEFRGKRMSVEDFSRIVDECRGKVSTFSLYYLGDPYMHPDVDAMCRLAFDAGINVHLSTNFSFKFSDERIASICRSGVTHLSVCVDGFSQETYGQTRVGGKLTYVLSNLERVMAYRNAHRLKYPRVEVQYIKFQHNVHELDEALTYFRRIGVDHVENFWGMVNNYVELEPESFNVHGPKPKKLTSQCPWPFGAMTIRYDGDVIPCCVFRHGAQYEESGDTRTFGNVFRDGVRGIWNSQPYRDARRLALDPTASDRDPKLKEHFCYGCPALYETDQDKNVRMANDHEVERGGSPQVIPAAALIAPRSAR